MTQIRWIDKYLAGEKVFASKTPTAQQKAKDVTPEMRAKFEEQIKQVAPAQRGKAVKKPRMQQPVQSKRQPAIVAT